MKGEYLMRVLEMIGATTVNLADLAAAIVSLPYGARRSQIERRVRQIRHARALVYEKPELQERYRVFLHRLKKDNLIEQRTINNKTLLMLSKKGREKLARLKERFARRLPDAAYSPVTTHAWTIVAFDVPERERRKRDWLRSVLQRMGFRMIQKSVWIGKKKMPQLLLNDMHRIRITNYVDIFEINKAGTLRRIPE